MKRVVRVDEPLLGGEEMAEVRDDLRLGLDGEIADRLHEAVRIFDGEARATPFAAAQRVRLPAVLSRRILADLDCPGGLDRHRTDSGRINQEQTRVNILRQDVAGNTDSDRTRVFGKRFL